MMMLNRLKPHDRLLRSFPCRARIASVLRQVSLSSAFAAGHPSRLVSSPCPSGGYYTQRTHASSSDASPEVSAPPAPAQHAVQNYPIEAAGLNEHQLNQLRTYLDYMLEINKSMNLTAVRDPQEAWHRHIGDSLSILPVIDRHAENLIPAPSGRGSGGEGAGEEGEGLGDEPDDPPSENRGKARGGRRGKKGKGKGSVRGRDTGGPIGDPEGGGMDLEASEPPAAAAAAVAAAGPSERSNSGGGGDPAAAQPAAAAAAAAVGPSYRVIDVGTGAGLPGMVLAIARPHWRFTLLDTLRKRCDFLAQAAERAGLTNVDVVWARAEDAGRRPDLRDQYDMAVARAVAETRTLGELCLPFVRPGGLWIAPKGPNPQVEVDAASESLKKLGGRLVALELVETHSVDGQRTCLVVSKESKTPAKYPRRPGTPNKDPL